MSYLCQECKKKKKTKQKLGVSDFVSKIKCVVNYPDFENLVHVIQYDLQGLDHYQHLGKIPYVISIIKILKKPLTYSMSIEWPVLFVVKHIEGESTEAIKRSWSYFSRRGSVA